MSDPNRTQFAMRALSLADIFNTVVGKDRVGSYRVVLNAPDGPSTGGGKQAVQHISLIPERGATITAGAANPVDKTAELRSWDHLAQLHAQRFKGKTLPLDRVKYNLLLKRMQVFFGEQRMSVVLVDAPKGSVPIKPAASRAALFMLFIAIACGVGGAMYFLLNMKR